MDGRAVETLAHERLEGVNEEWEHLNGLAEKAQLKVEGLMGAKTWVGMLCWAEEESAGRVSAFGFAGLDAPTRLEEHGIGAGVAIGASGCTRTIRPADGALKYSAERSPQHVAADFERQVEEPNRSQFE
jgi:hypothetical protein